MRDEVHQPSEVTSGSDYVRDDLLEVMSACSPALNPALSKRLEGRPVVRAPRQLRLHRALDELGWTGAIDEFNGAALLKNQSIPEPILITGDGTILGGIGRWRLALFEGRQEIHCIEYPLTEEESLEFMLICHRSRTGWNRFVRTCLGADAGAQPSAESTR